MSDPIGVAFVGCTHPHILARLALLQRAEDVQLVGCYDPDSALRAALEARYGLSAFANPGQLLDMPGVRLVIVEGWEPDNPGYVRLALARKQAVLLEKPGAADLAQMRALVSDIAQASVPFQIGYQLRFGPVIPHVKRILQSGVLGPITLARFHAAAPVGGAREIWQSVPGMRGGVVYTDGCHMIDLIIHLLGAPQRVSGSILKLPEGPPVIAHGFKEHTLAGPGKTVEMPLGGLRYEDAGAAILGYTDKVVTFDITGWEAHPWVEAWAIQFYGTNGTLQVGLQPPRYHLYVRNATAGYQAGWHRWEGFSQTGLGNSASGNTNYVNEMTHLLARVRTWDTANAAELGEAEAVVAVLDAIFRSHETQSAAQLVFS